MVGNKSQPTTNRLAFKRLGNQSSNQSAKPAKRPFKIMQHMVYDLC